MHCPNCNRIYDPDHLSGICPHEPYVGKLMNEPQPFNEPNMNLIAPGSPVKLAGGDAKGIVVQISIWSMHHWMYEVAWWDRLERREQWMRPEEIEAIGYDDYIEIGFHSILEKK